MNRLRISSAVLVPLLVAFSHTALGQKIPANATRIDTIAIELTTKGFTQTQLSHSAGQVLIFVHNKSGPAPRSLAFSMLTSTSPTVLRQPSLTQTHPHWFEVMTLSAGTYQLTEGSHPTWNCTITIQ